MKKAIMLSIQPKYCELIASGRKTIEFCKTRPSIPPQSWQFIQPLKEI